MWKEEKKRKRGRVKEKSHKKGEIVREGMDRDEGRMIKIK